MCSRTEGDCQPSGPSGIALEILSFIGVSLSIVGLVLTIITMLAFRYFIATIMYLLCFMVTKTYKETSKS